ncbi:rhomboid family intramembrane serine protease [Flavobacterium psychrotolerans]|uniref:Peptidase S54 rhomboid domain-containing protein n=1 Tax=Flavobacterium psychrotolerans TaxID=2169410 RepID=A0A2U1JQP0_9FLAO|nr:rhomboid family intramembrane serine protease [Flavobacterium psychrotolerans]PWA07452.1 hypothetical protein DB895_01670 [Flavobacterium psychrotolerans]
MLQDFSNKVRFIYLPFLATIIGFIVTYSFLNWLLVIKLEWLEVNEQIIEFFAPLVLAFGVVYLLLRPRIKLLQFKKDNGATFLYMIVGFAIAIPTIIVQKYLATATGTLTELEHIYELESHPRTKYYNLKRFYFYSSESSFTRKVNVSGKHHRDLNFALYCVQPILKTAKDTVKEGCHYWLCKKYHYQVRNSLSHDVKERAFDDFIQKSESDFRSTYFGDFSYLEHIGITNDAKMYKKALQYNVLVSDGSDVLLETCYGKFENRNEGTLGWIFKSLAIGVLVFLLLLLCYKFKSENTSSLLKINKKRKGWRETFELLIPRKDYFMTPILIDLNLLVYLIMVMCGLGFFSFEGEDLYRWGAVHRSSVLHGEWWRLLTCIFLHGNLMHILNNLLSLYFVSFFLEPILGRWCYLFVYIICGLCASLTSIYWHKNGISVGASGAVFGLFGFMLALIVMKVFEPALNRTFFIITSVFVGYNLLMGLAGGVDNAAHIGGVLGGFVIGLIFSERIQEEIEERNKNK